MKRGCTQCGECLNVCPVYALFKREEYAPKGKRLLMEPLDAEYGDAATAQLSWERVRQLARLCAGCGRCQRVCARKLSTSELLARRAGQKSPIGRRTSGRYGSAGPGPSGPGRKNRHARARRGRA